MSAARTAVVTGASRGIGRAIARRLAGEGFELTLSARSAEALDEVAGELRTSGSAVRVAPANLAVEDQVVALADAYLQDHDGLDLLVLCAGTGTAGELGDYPMSRFDRQLTVNLRAPVLLVQRLLPVLRAAAAARPEAGAKIVAIASLAGVVAEPNLAAYSASKAGLISLCESITVAEAAQGVSATAISPGYVDTDMSEWIHDRIDPKTMIRAEDIAELVTTISKLSRYAVIPNIVVTRPGPTLWRA